MRPLFALAALLAVLAVAGCEGDDDDDRLRVVATTTQVADFAREIAGDRARVDQILEPNSDPHDYEPRPSDARAVAKADVVLRSGGDVDEWLDDLLDNAGGDAEVVTLSESVRLEDDDPHWWQDPVRAGTAVAVIGRVLARADAPRAAAYRRSADRYRRRLARLSTGIERCIDRIPPDRRKLVTTHDALGYYADRYGLEVIGALIPSQSSEAQPSAKDTQELIDQIEDENVPAIFPEQSLSPKLEDAVSNAADAAVGDELYTDALGDEDSDGATYIDSLRANTRAITEGLSGRPCNPGTPRGA